MMLMTRWLRRIMLCGDAVALFAACLAATSLGAAAQPAPKTWSRFAVPAHPIAGVHHLQVYEPVGYSWPLKLGLWFKTSRPGMVLLSTGNSVIGSTSTVDDGGDPRVHGPADVFDGDVSDVEFCDYALSPDEVMSLYNRPGDTTQFGMPPSAERLSGAAITVTAPLRWGLFLSPDSPDERHPCDVQKTLA
jgi:hypothetical protein